MVERALCHQTPRVSLHDAFRSRHGADHIVLVQAHAVCAQKGQLPAGVGGPADDFAHVRESNMMHYTRSICRREPRMRGATTTSMFVDAGEIAVFKKQTEVR